MKKRLISTILTIVLLFCMVPAEAFAYIGAKRETATGVIGGVYEDLSSRKMAYIQNDYISFHICVEADSSLQEGSICYTIPTSEITTMDDLSIYGMQQIGFRVDNQEELVLIRKAQYREEQDVYGYKSVLSQPFFLLVNDVTYSIDKTKGTITVNYTFTDKAYTAKSVFSLVRLDRGLTYDAATAELVFPVRNDNSDTSQNWGVMCNTEVYCSKEKCVTDVTMLMSYTDFPKTGHSGADGSAHVYASMASEYNMINYGSVKGAPLSYKSLDITAGIGETGTEDIDEIFVDSYNCANPFAATGDIYMFDTENIGLIDAWGVEGHNDYYCGAFSYKGSTLTTADTQYTFKAMAEEGGDVIPGRYANLWGFRDLKTIETAPPVTERDNVVVPANAQYLAVVKNGSTYSVKQAATKADVDKLSGVAAAFRGTYTYDKINKRYIFDKNVELSPSITAAWETGTGVYLDEDGTLHIDQANVSLNAPSFKFYKPKNGGFLKVSYSSDERGGLCIGLDHGKNGAVVSLNFPNVICKMETAYIDMKGNLTFEGEFGIESLFDGATIDMDKLSYGLKNGEMKLNGIHAAGEINLPEGKLFGLGAADIEGEINTFNGEEDYKFSLELTVGELFSAKARLELIRLNNGRLCPEDLFIFIKSEVDGAGLDITPGTPVVTLTGGGGGITGLASTISGNYSAIPPVVITLAASGEIAKVVDGYYQLEVGPSKLKASAEDLAIKVGNEKAQLITKLSAGLFAEEKDMVYEGTTFAGYNFGGDAALGLKIFNIQEDDKFMYATLGWFNGTVTANVELGVNGFIGENEESAQFITYLGLMGKADANLQIPERIPLIGGHSLLGGALDFKLGGASVMPANNANVKSMFENLKVTGGVVATASIIGISGRVIYLIPKTIEVEGKLAKKFGDWDWDTDPQKYQKTATTMLLSQPILAQLDSGEDVLMFASVKAAPVMLAAEPGMLLASAGSFSQTVSPEGIEQLGDNESLILAIVPANQSDVYSFDDFKSSLSIVPGNGTSLSTPTSLKYLEESTENVNGENVTAIFVNSSENVGKNAWVGTYKSDASGKVTQRAVFVSIPKSELDGVTSFSISAGEDFNVNAAATQPQTGLDVTYAAGTLNAAVTNPEAETVYRLYTYYGSEEGSAEYLVNMTKASSLSNFVLPTSGITVPTGVYYPTVFLTEEVTIVNENHEEEVFELPVDSFAVSETVSYTKVNTVEAPTNVILDLSGNEVMTASWTASTTEGVDGYKITIYQEDGHGNFVDTERGYMQSVSDFGNQGALRYDSASKTYSIEMAMTVGGEGENISVTDPSGETYKTNGSSSALEAEKKYKVGITAYKESVHAGVSCPNYSEEALSTEKLLPKYQPLALTMKLNGADIEKSGNGVFEGTIGDVNGLIEIAADKSPVSYSIRRTDLNEVFSTEELFNLPEFEGMLPLEIKASYTHDGVTDDSYEYALISKDNTAPVLTLDKDAIIADGSGNFTITGMCGANDSVSGTFIIDWTQQVINAAANTSGAFSISGNIGSESGVRVTLTAKDAADNSSAAVIAMVSKEPETIEIPANKETDPGNDPQEGGGSSGRKPAKAKNPFVDVNEGDYFYEPVLWAAERGITSGIDATHFAPYDQTTRAQMVTFLWNAAGKPEPGISSCPFTDVAEGTYYYKAVLWAYENQIAAGVGADKFAPNDLLNRAQAVTFLWRADGAGEIDNMTAGGPAPCPFTDVQNGTYYYNAVLSAKAKGITSGVSETKFAPLDKCTRAQVVTFLYNREMK